MSAYSELRLYAPTEADALAAAIDALPHGLELVVLSEDGETYVWRCASVDHAFASTPGPVDHYEGVTDPETGDEILVPMRSAGFGALLRIRPAREQAVRDLLATVGAAHGVQVVDDVGAEFA